MKRKFGTNKRIWYLLVGITLGMLVYKLVAEHLL